MAEVILKVSQSVNSGSTVADTYVVPNGKTATVIYFQASAPDSPLALVRLSWDYGGGGESDEWIEQRDGKFPPNHYPQFTGDGTKKLAIVADNGCSDTYYFNGYAVLEVE
jgi:hypothetical protein